MISEIDCCGGGGVWEMGKERIFDNGIFVICTGIFFSRNIVPLLISSNVYSRDEMIQKEDDEEEGSRLIS